MIGPGVASAPAMPAVTEPTGVRGDGVPRAEAGAGTSAFGRLMAPSETATAAPLAASATTETRDTPPDTAEATQAAPDPSQLLAWLSQATVAGASTAPSAAAAGGASPDPGAAALAGVAGMPTPTGTASVPGLASADGTAAGSALDGIPAPPLTGTLAAPGGAATPGPSATALGAAPGATPALFNIAAFAGPAALPGMTPATATPALTPGGDAPSLAPLGDMATPADADSAGLIDATRGGDAATGGPAWLAAAPPSPAASAPSATASALPATLAMPADPADGFDDGLTTQVTWMAGNGVGEARIRITPDHLGTIDLVLNIEGQRISAEFQSAHADVRQALEGGLARLRDQLAQHGLQLVQAQVGDGSHPRHQPHRDDAPAQRGEDPELAQAATLTGPVGTPGRRARLLDTYA